MKVSSPEIPQFIEADGVHKSEGNKIDFALVKSRSLYRGLSPWYGVEWKSQKLGRSKQLSRQRIFANNLKKRGSEDGRLEVGLLRSRGVIGVMSYESNAHSKGAALVCRGEVKHGPYKEME